MKCTGCGQDNREGRKFCSECGAPLASACPACGAANEPGEKFCGECGAAMRAPAAQSARSGATITPHPDAGRSSREARKIVTIIFADLAGSTALHERLDPESVRRFMESYYRALRGAVEAHAGTVVKFLGDGVMAAFGVPRVAEDDAMRAVRAGVEMQRAFRELAQGEIGATGDIGLRVAINTGEVVVSADNADIVGDPVNVAARLQQEAGDGEVVIGEATQRLVASKVTLEPLGRFALKGRSVAVKAYRVASLDRPEGVATAAFVGRDQELARINGAYNAALAEKSIRLAVLLGSPGLGKSRMIEEFAHRLGDAATVLQAHCDADGGATFAPLVRALREFFEVEDGAPSAELQEAVAASIPEDDADRPRITRGISSFISGSPATPEETFFVLRRLLGALARSKPVMLVVDDLHWAEPLLLEFIEHLVQWGSGLRLFVLIGARPELREIRSSLVTPGGPITEVVMLSGLDAGAAMRLAANVIGVSDLPSALAAKVLATSEGNPLFVGELVRMLVQEGAIERQGDRWIVSDRLNSLEMPPTIHALLAARIERLHPEELAVLERAAVVGRQFSRAAVAELLPRDATDIDKRLEALRRAELIERDTGWFIGEPVLRFHHVLIRDAAYRRILKGTRAELHTRLAAWIESRGGDATELEEMLGWHLEQAHQHLRELGSLDDAARELGKRAALHLSAAGRRALARDDVALAASLLGRAIERLESDDPARADLALDWCEALLAAGEVGSAAKAIEELGRFAGDSERLRAWHTCFAGQLTVMTEPQSLNATSERVAAAARDLASLEDAAGEAKAHFVNAQALARLGKVGACEAALDQALAAARRAGDRRRANAVLAGAPLAALWGPSPVTRASGRCLDVVRVLRITQGAPAVEAVALSCQGLLEALRGRTDAARRMIESARKMVEELGITHRVLETDVFARRIDLLEGKADIAEEGLRRSFEGLRDLGLGIDAARAAALLGRALLEQGRAEEAESASRESEQLAGDDLQASIAWRGVRAEALARRGDHAAAIESAKAAVSIAAATDALLDHADARLALAIALRAAGRKDEANQEERRAFELWEEKGATVLLDRARNHPGPASIAAPAPQLASEVRPLPLRNPAEAASPSDASHRRFRETPALRQIELHHAAIVAHDVGALRAQCSPDMKVFYHPTGTPYGTDELVETWKSAFGAKNLRCKQTTLATLGESLVLVRQLISHDGLQRGDLAEAGPIEVDTLLITQVEENEKSVWAEVFAGDRLSDAITRLYERYAELMPEGGGRQAAAKVPHSFEAFSHTREPDRLMQGLARSYVNADHRTLATWRSDNPDELVGHFQLQHELASEFNSRDEDILALEPRAMLIRRTYYGMAKDSGGSFENPLLGLWIFDDDGLVSRTEIWDAEQESEALARFDELSPPGSAASGPIPRRVRPNAALRNSERFVQAIQSRDRKSLNEMNAPDVGVIHHPTGAIYGAEAVETLFESLWRTNNLRIGQEPLATLGDSLALSGRFLTHDGVDDSKIGSFGPVEMGTIAVVEVDALERTRLTEIFAADRLGAAIARLYERYAELQPEGPDRERAATAARSYAAFVGRTDLQRMREAMHPSHISVDHRPLGTWSAQSAEEMIEHFRLQEGLATEFSARDEDVLALEPEGFLVRRTAFGEGRVSGGSIENRILLLVRFGVDGRMIRAELWDPDQGAEALARFEELCSPKVGTPASPSSAFDNAAAQADETLMRCFNARDWQGVLACIAPEVVFDERRRMVRNMAEREVWLEQFRMMYDLPESRFTIRLLATRGERLSLHRHEFNALVAEGGGPLEMEPHMTLHEVDEEGRIIAIVLFDLQNREDAYAELDRRYEAGEGSLHPEIWKLNRAFVDAVASRDWDPVIAMCAPEIVEYDHRHIAVLGTTLGPEAWTRNFQTLVDLAADTRYRTDHFRGVPRGGLSVGTWYGSRWGGEYELPLVPVIELNDEGRIIRADIYDLDQYDQARARFAELGAAPQKAGTPFASFANSATRAIERFNDSSRRNEWPGLAVPLAEGFRYFDRRRMAQIELNREQYVKFTKEFSGGRSVSSVFEMFATRGERLALFRWCGVVSGGDVGPSQIDHLNVIEADERGELTEQVRFDADDFDAAYAELEARYASGEGCVLGALPSKFIQGVTNRDWYSMVALCAPNFVEHDHRRLAVLGTTLGAEAWVRNFRIQVDLAPDTRARYLHIRGCPRAMLFLLLWEGSRDGGDYELPILGVAQFDGQYKLLRVDVYDPEQIDIAHARFAELEVARSTSTPEDTYANAATRASALIGEYWRARDWEGIRRMLPADFRYHDRQKAVRVELDREQYIDNLQVHGEIAHRELDVKVMATRGERLELSRHRLVLSDDDSGPSEIVTLRLIETDERGHPIALVRFDVDALDAAYAELEARYEAGEAAAHPLALSVLRALHRAGEAWSWDEVIALCAPNVVRHDRRPLAVLGTTRGGAAWMGDVKALVDLAPDTSYRIRHVRLSSHALLFEGDWFGTRDGGEYEMPLLPVIELNDEGRIVQTDLHDPDQADEAWARFGAIDGTAGVAPGIEGSSNRATRLNEKFVELWGQRDWDGIEALHSPTTRYDDRRKLMRIEVSRESAMKQLRFLFDQPGGRMTMKPLATRGQRLALTHILYEGFVDAKGGDLSIEYLGLDDLDDQGRFKDVVLFDPDDVEAAYAELDARWQASDASIHPLASRWAAELARCCSERDWDAMRRLFTPDQVSHNHRLVGWGMISGGDDGWVPTVKAFVDLSPDVRFRLDHERTRERGVLAQYAWVGTREGGAFETPILLVAELNEEGRQTRLDIWDPEHVAEAQARFESIGSAADKGKTEHPFANAASRAVDRLSSLFLEGSLEHRMQAFKSLATPDFVYSDRRKGVLLELGLKEIVKFNRSLWGMKSRQIRSRLMATRGERLALVRLQTEVSDDKVGASEFCHLNLFEVDARGLLKTMARWDEDDLDAAYAELDARFLAGEGAQWGRHSEFLFSHKEALICRDWDALAALYDRDIVGHDHRLVSWGTLKGPTEFLKSLREMVELAPDVRMILKHVRARPGAALQESLWVGTRDGGAFESPFISVAELNEDNRARQLDFYDPRQIDQALARFGEIGNLNSPEALRLTVPPIADIRPNRVAEAGRRWLAALEAGISDDDWEPARAITSPDVQFEDRQRLSLVSGNRDVMIESLRARGATGARADASLIGIAGDSVAVIRMLWSGGPADGRFEVEYVCLIEIDESGLLTASILFDPVDLRAAQREMWKHWAAIDPSSKLLTDALGALVDAFNDRDPVRARAAMTEDMEVEDHRRTGMGRIQGAESYVAALTALWDLSQVSRAQVGWFWLAHERNLALTVLRLSGANADGGPFESESLYLFTVEQGRISRLELFEMDALDHALARFEEIRGSLNAGISNGKSDLKFRVSKPSFLDGHENRAIRTFERYLEALQRGLDQYDSAVRSICSSDFQFEDRQRMSQISGDTDLMIRSWQERIATGARAASTLAGFVANRLLLTHMFWTGGPEDGRFVIEYYALSEINEQGQLSHLVLLDADDPRAAQRAMWERWAAIDPSSKSVTHALAVYADAFNDRDRDRLRAAVADDLHLVDQRRTGMGRIEGGDAYLHSVEALWELSRSARPELGWFWLAQEGALGLTVAGLNGMNADGGDFETRFLMLFSARQGCIAHIEFFEMEALHDAIARFEELKSSERENSPEAATLPPGVKPNRAARFLQNLFTARMAADWKDPASEQPGIWAPGYVFEDRQRMARVSGGPELGLESFRARRESGAEPLLRLIGTAGERLAVFRTFWTGGPSGGRFEIEHLSLVELDDSNLLARIILFDPEDLRIAQRELWSRWSEIDPSTAELTRVIGASIDAFNARDRDRVRTLFRENAAVVDHRRLRILGEFESPDAYVASVAQIWELSGDSRDEMGWFWLAQDRNLALTPGRISGTNLDGGEFAIEALFLFQIENGQFARVEFFEPEATEEALARFRELTADPDAKTSG